MSTAEIGDNRWEVSASKPPVGTAGGLLQLLMIGCFSVLFGWIAVSSVIAIVTPKKEGTALHEKFDKMQKGEPTPTAP